MASIPEDLETATIEEILSSSSSTNDLATTQEFSVPTLGDNWNYSILGTYINHIYLITTAEFSPSITNTTIFTDYGKEYITVTPPIGE